MATSRIPSSRSLMCAAVYDERTGQQPIVVNNNKLHIFPDWHNCYQTYQTTMVSSFGGLTLTGNGSFTDTWRSPWETTVDMSKSSRSIFTIAPMMLTVMRGTFGGESKQSEFETFVNTAEKIWGVKFEYSKDRSIARALCPSDAAPSGLNGDKFSDNAIKGSLCFCTKVDCKKDDSDGYMNMTLKQLMLACGHNVCYVVCEVDPKGFVEASVLSKRMMPVEQKDDSMAEVYSYCVKGVRVFVGESSPVNLKRMAESTEDGKGGYISVQSVSVRYMTLLLNSKTNPTAYRAYDEYATIIREDEWDDDIQGSLPSRTPIRNYTAVKGKYWEELG